MERQQQQQQANRPLGTASQLPTVQDNESDGIANETVKRDTANAAHQSSRMAPTALDEASLSPLSSQEALVRLHDDMKDEIAHMEQEFARRPFLSRLVESISFKSELSKIRWPSVVFMTAHVVAHFIVAFILNIDNLATNWIGFQGFVLFIFLLFNLAVNLWDTKLRFKELLMKAEQVADLIGRCSRDRHLLKKWRQFNWKSASARTLFIPKSPCVHQTLTYRDESCLNLPDYLLVRGDIIHLFPGDRAPGDCISLTTTTTTTVAASGNGGGQAGLDATNFSDNERVALKEDEIFHVVMRQHKESNNETKTTTAGRPSNSALNANDRLGSHAKLKRPKRGTDFLMLSTPYIKSLRISLQRSHKRPVNSIEKECFIVSRKYFETYVIPLVFVLSTIVTAIHYGYLDLVDSDQQIKTVSIAYLLLRPSLTIMPFLPWMFPCFWMAVNAYGSARLLCCAETQRSQRRSDSPSRAADWFQDGQSPTDWDSSAAGKRVPASDGMGLGGTTKSTVGPFENLLATPTAGGSSDQNRHEEEDLQDLQNKIKFVRIFGVFIDLILGRSGHVWRSSSLLQVLGCLTSLCCIDKVGLLSWPNPTPEKVLVLTKSQQANQQANQRVGQHNVDSRRASQSDDGDGKLAPERDSLAAANVVNLATGLMGDTLALNQIGGGGGARGSCQVSTSNIHAASMKHAGGQHRVEILDLSQAFNAYRTTSDFLPRNQEMRLQFDDPNWTKFLANLKPLGLAVLMNNCCEQSFGDYFRFYKHISFESIVRCNLTPVVKRRCICALAKLIGFTTDAIRNYKYVHQIGAYKLIDPSAIKQQGKLMPSLEMTSRLKLPFPNMICNIHQDTVTGCFQASSQGTADIILGACVEFWNGKELVPLDESTRKKALDFYHRTSLTSYCSAYSYTPLLRNHKLAGNYIEMPSDSSKFRSQLRKLAIENAEEFLHMQIMGSPVSANRPAPVVSSDTNLSDSHSVNYSTSTPILVAPNYGKQSNGKVRTKRRLLRRHLSAEEFHDLEPVQDYNQDQDPESRGPSWSESRKRASRRRELDEALDELTDQVFVGMVAMQYQACPDFVALVEQLEHACIRFVHFSKENELRSRVFSEKMGLESGWNCHISLQSDTDLDRAERDDAVQLSHQTTGCLRSPISRRKMAPAHKAFAPTTRITNILIGSQANDNLATDFKATTNSIDLESNLKEQRANSIASEVGTLHSWKSLPSLVMQIIAKVSNVRKHHHNQQQQQQQQQEALLELNKDEHQVNHSSGDELLPEAEYGDAETGEISPANSSNREVEQEEEEEEEEESAEGFDTLAFDMSNRAKLPKGIENIRPHLETVDNIPLQVSLFTDCTPELTKEMIEIMQDYGEIVCVIGSASSRTNTPVFLQANASIAVEPLMPICCTQARHSSARKCQRQRDKASRDRPKRTKTRSSAKTKRASKIIVSSGEVQISSANKVESPLLKPLNNPRDRLGIGPTKFNEPLAERYNRLRRDESERSFSSRSSSSSSSSSSASSSSSSSSSSTRPNNDADGEVSHLSQSLSDTESSSGDESSSCSSHESERDEDLNGDDGDDLGERNAIKIHDLAKSLVHELPNPGALAAKLASLPCSYNYNRKDPVYLYSLIMEARHFTFKMKNTFVCMICFALSISSAQFLASILFLPPMLSSGLTIWLTVVVVPLMSFSLMSTTMDSQVMKIAVGKNLQLKPENITFFVICYLIKFIPSIIVVVLNFGLIIAHSCKSTGFGSSSLGPCWMFTYVRHDNSTSKEGTGEEDLLWSSHLLTAQVSAAFLMVLYFVVISSGFVHRSHLMWQRNPMRNRFWVAISLTLIFGQLLVNQLVLQVNLKSTKVPYEFIASLPLHIWLISFMWPILVICINLFVKRAEIKATIRQQRRARFDFNTKLGMNSPF